MLLDDVYRRAVLGIADAGVVRNSMQRVGWRLGVGRFVAGETIEAALPALRSIEASGKRVILDLLGEFVDTEAGALQMAAEVRHALESAAAGGVEPYLSVKPTQLGLGVSADLALQLATDIVRRAAELGGHVCLDMENSPQVDGTLDLLERLRAGGHHNVSTVLQSYLMRSVEDLERLLALSPMPPLRIVKGAYREGADVAYQDKRTVDRAYRELVFRALDARCHVNVATHDEAAVAEVISYARGANLTAEQYEIQMLYGVKPQLQDRLLAAGHTLRVYVPFGHDWYGYFSRRLAERPANAAFVVRGLFG